MADPATKPAPHPNTDFIRQAVEWLHTAPFGKALDFYEDMAKDPACDDWTIAKLGKKDRFFLLTHLCKRLDAIHPWQYERAREVEAEPDECLDLWARDHYKAVDINEPVLTPKGWVKHGDLFPGDYVYSPEGSPVQVIARTPVFTQADCYRVAFSCGYSVVVSGDHLWTLRHKVKRRVKGSSKRRIEWRAEVICTRDLIGKKGRLDVGRAKAIQFPEKQLPIDPYVLGIWLGDGSSSSPRITAGAQDVNELEQLLVETGIQVRRVKHSNSYSLHLGNGVKCKKNSSDLVNALRALDLLQNKHIPEIYLRSSYRQRWALLQGLMDTDGSVDQRGTATFVQKCGVMAEQVRELISSLGMKANLRQHSLNWNGERYSFWQVSFQVTGDAPFRLSRKKARCYDPIYKQDNRFITSIEPVESIPVSCIQVAREDGQYLIGKSLVPTHNSTWITFAGSIQEILNDPEITIGIFSHTRPIARGFSTQIKTELETNEILKRLYPDVLFENPARESRRWSADAFIVKRQSNPKEATVEAWGMVDGQPTSTHFALLIFDDVVTLENVNTPDQIIKTTLAWEVAQNLGRSQNPRRWHIGTRYNFADTWGVLLGRKFLKPRIYPATDDGTINGQPVFLSPEVLDKKKRESSLYTFACQQLLNPVAGSEQTFKPEWVRYWEVRPKTLNVYITVDYAGSRPTTGSSNTAMTVTGMDPARNKYLLDGLCHKMSLSERWRNLRALRRYWINQPGVQLVKVGYERYGAQSDIEHFQEMMRIEGDAFPIEELNWPREGQHAKDERIKRLQPDHQNWRYFYPLPETGPYFDDKGQLVVANPISQPQVTKLQSRAVQSGEAYLVAKPIRAKDENGKIYDVVLKFIENEYLFFPNTTYKDFFDSMSRIYDMDPHPPQVIDERDTLPEIPED